MIKKEKQTKVCPVCGIIKPLTAQYWHYKNKKNKVWAYECKGCKNIRQKKADEIKKQKKEAIALEKAMLEKKEMELLYEKALKRQQEENKGLDTSKLALEIGKRYKVTIPIRLGTNQKQQFIGELVQICDTHVIIKGKAGYCQSFMKADLLIDHEIEGAR